MSNHTTHSVMIPISHLWADGAYQPRHGLTESHVRLLLTSDPATWPSLLVAPSEDGRFRVIDGFHRLEAATRLGLTTLPCIVDSTAGYPEGFAANLQHGLPLSIADRKAFACWLAEEEPGLSLRELGCRCGLNHETVKRALEEDERGGGNRHPTQPDPIAKLVRQVERTYRDGAGRTWLGFGKAGNPGAFRRSLEAYAEEDRPAVARAMLAFGHACVAAAQPYLVDGEER